MYLLRFILYCVIFSYVRSEFDFDLLDTAKNPFQYLEEFNYTYENHTVVTEDGYELLLVRIPYNRNDSSANTIRPAVLFVHGILASFNDFLVSGPGISFGFEAVEQGYDVFLLNTRGSRWSRSHTTLDPDLNANAYWNFSWHEVGVYDLPATIDYILNLTGQSKLSYVGHSQGTTALLVLGSTRPEYNAKLDLAILLAPVAFLGNSQFAPILLLKNSAEFTTEVVEILQVNEVAPYTPTFSQTGRLICSSGSVLAPTCEEIYETDGPSAQINDSLISAYVTNYPAGASAKELLHFLQNAKSGKFRLYDYEDGNLAEYDQLTPPDYNLSAITVPIALFHGVSDYFTALVDIATLAISLPNVVDNVLISLVQTNHLDLLIGTLTHELVTEPALNVLNQYNDL